MKKFVLLSMLFLLSLPAWTQQMNNEGLEKIFTEFVDTISGQAGAWEMVVNDQYIICITDEGHNRMRIIAPIVEVERMNAEELLKCMEANFHTALDVKYAISDGVLWSTFIHPLKELSEGQVADALAQVYNAAVTFGSSYSSTDLFFPGSKKQEEPPKKGNKKT
ncbi:MAG: hypothetical protein AAGH79_12775 [Bacteroidota bacterium]